MEELFVSFRESQDINQIDCSSIFLRLLGEPCAAGTSSAAGSDSCFSCAINQYSDTSSACQKCQDGYTSPGGTASCTLILPVAPCAPGTIGSNGNCTQCPLNFFSKTAGVSECSPCLAGFESLSNGSTSCSACPYSTYVTRPGSPCGLCPITSTVGRASNACNSTTGQPTQWYV